MLHDFLTRERNTILLVAKQKAIDAKWARMASDNAEEGWGAFYDELTGLLKGDEASETTADKIAPMVAAEKQGKEYLRLGYAISEVVQSYSIIHQAIMESASKLGFDITPEELQKLNLSLDIAVADVVIDFEKVQTAAEDLHTATQDQAETERLGFLAHELRNSLQSATITLQMVEGGIVDVKSKTGQMLQSSLHRMSELIDRALAEVRMRLQPDAHLKKVRVNDILNEVEVTAKFMARQRKLNLRMQGPSTLEVLVDRHLFVSALSNLVQNALKFTKPDGTIRVCARQEGERVVIEVEDECGGLPEGKIEELFMPGVKKSEDQSGLGLGLAISKQAIERNKGELRVENLPSKGCIFIIDLPRVAAIR
jgi:signal transduction histidine kinase